MATLFQKYAALKTRIGGNRELHGYEETFGMPREEQQHITPVPRYVVRILSETEFAIRLSKSLGGKYDEIIGSELDFLTGIVDEEGCITKSAAKKAEEMLLPMSAEAKEYKLILAGHAHIDMNWMWSWQETVAATVATFTTMLNIMDEYPEFCFSQSQTAVYKIIDDYAPELHDRIKARIDEGRWEVTSSAWVETDKNMPNTESIVRHIGYSKKYLAEKWGVPADKLEVDFSPDTFGHSANLPELDNYGGVKYYYHCRGLNGDNALYRWKAPSGKEMIVYREQHWYNSGITPKIAMPLIDISERSGGLKTGLVVYGVGDHGGGPTRRDVERGIEMQDWPVFPTIKFGTFREFFKEAETVREKLPVVDHELNFIFPGCYTTQTRLKKGNRQCEGALSEAETALAFAHIRAGAAVHSAAVESAWQKVLFTHFHDILTGSCVQDSREHAMGLFQDALATANTETSLALGKLSAKIDTSMIVTQRDPNSQAEGAGAGYNIERFAGRAADERGMGLTRIWNVFNNTYADREEPVEITAWDWTGDMRYIRVTDAEGNPLEFQLIDGGLQQYWDHKYFRFLVYLKVPAMGYTTVVLSQGEMGDYPVYLQGTHRTNGEDRNYVLENELVRYEFDYSTGALVSMKDKETGREYIPAGKKGGVVLIDTNRHNSSAWNIGTHLETIPVTNVNNIHGTIGGGLRRGFAFDAKIRSSSVTVEYTLDKGAKAVKAHIRVDWSEVGGDKIPVLSYELPTSVECDKFAYNVPGGRMIRDAAEADRPGLSYITTYAGKNTVNPGIIADSKYGFRGIVRDGCAVVQSTLINTATSPDPYPERGIHNITLTIGLFPSCPVEMEKESVRAVHNMTPISTGSHKGELAPSGTFMKFDSDGAVLSAVYADDDKICVRCYSVSDDETEVRIDAQAEVKEAYAADLLENRTADAAIDGSVVTAKLAPKTISTIVIKL
ncbi:MAG: glycoside hydrolase family 38 C-terminal domain-containing protein [Eubacteriales bacterium]